MAADADSCGFYARRPGERCRQPRSCYDCLNVRVAAEPLGCFIAPYGACEPMIKYASDMDFRNNDSSVDSGDLANLQGGWYHAFPSSNTSYCEAADAACGRCREVAENASRVNSLLASTTKFCRGVGGCVCIVSCESVAWSQHVLPACDQATPTPTPVPQPAAPSNHHSQRLVWYFAIAQLPLLLLIAYTRARWLRCQRRRKAPQHQLRLSAWRALHEELIEQDRNRPQHVESVLHSALPPSAAPNPTRPPLMTRAERTVWRGGAGAN